MLFYPDRSTQTAQQQLSKDHLWHQASHLKTQQLSVGQKIRLDNLVTLQNLVNFVPLFAALRRVILLVRTCSLMEEGTPVLSKELTICKGELIIYCAHLEFGYALLKAFNWVQKSVIEI